MHSCPMNGEQGRESYDDNRSHDLPRIYEVSGIDTDEESSSTSSFIEVDSNSNIIACILISLLVESSCDQSCCIKYLHCSNTEVERDDCTRRPITPAADNCCGRYW